MSEEEQGNSTQAQKDDKSSDGGALFDGMENDGDEPGPGDVKASMNQAEVSIVLQLLGQTADGCIAGGCTESCYAEREGAQPTQGLIIVSHRESQQKQKHNMQENLS